MKFGRWQGAGVGEEGGEKYEAIIDTMVTVTDYNGHHGDYNDWLMRDCFHQ